MRAWLGVFALVAACGSAPRIPPERAEPEREVDTHGVDLLEGELTRPEGLEEPALQLQMPTLGASAPAIVFVPPRSPSDPDPPSEPPADAPADR